MWSAEAPSGRHVATAYMAYRPPPSRAPGQTRVWEDLRKEARRLEGELDVKLAAFTKLCSSFEASYKLNSTDSSALGADQQLAQTKAAEVEDLLQRLSDINDEMAAIVGGSSDSRSHTLARHRDILQEFTQEFRKVNATLGAALDRVKLLAGSSDSPLLSVQVQSSSGALLRERGTIQNSASMVDDLLSQASNVSGNLLQQRRVFESIADKLMQVGSRFPVVNGLLNAIRRKKSKDTLVLSGVIAACVLFTIIYVMAR
ncbi:Golgi SNAP receptor complex member 1-2 [Tetrabaena socialis]|uniref:Golgi SNAP receptor complex member 1-2 n=1 Tax=Tetrabaena socialis TaxID=47790 RepID=A0A2J8ACI0_9CHLO|nr:Golgi SNAP receptor complex member 1-2 [Tetrabaena socialis]|eukprot:PNH10224.1 Golgi SNAP receptor complex member 1-2 [Tetrabaena socialis]